MNSVDMLVVIIWRVHDEFSFYMVVVSENGAFCQVSITFDWDDFGICSLDVLKRSENIDIDTCVYYSYWFIISGDRAHSFQFN